MSDGKSKAQGRQNIIQATSQSKENRGLSIYGRKTQESPLVPIFSTLSIAGQVELGFRISS